jgi:uncharacterized protein YtpQ (UPF0354 family)
MALFKRTDKNSFKKIENKIYPYLKADMSGKDSDDANVMEFDCPSRPLVADLMVLFAIDCGDYLEILQREQVPADMSDDELYLLALNNLNNNIEFKFLPTNYGAYGIIAGGNFEASSLCLEHIWEYCAEKIGENLIVAVPNRDVVIMVGESQVEELAKMKARTAGTFREGDHPLTEQLLFYDRGEKMFRVYGSPIKEPPLSRTIFA